MINNQLKVNIMPAGKRKKRSVVFASAMGLIKIIKV